MNVASILKSRQRRIKSFSISSSLALYKGEAVCLHWSCSSQTATNFGDRLNPVIASYMFGKRVVRDEEVINFTRRPVFYFMGSILDGFNEANGVICGSGFKYANSRIRRSPLNVIAVRGPLTRDKLLKEGIECPLVFCDPGLFIADIAPPIQGEPMHDVGIVPHYVDQTRMNEMKIISGGLTHKIINIKDEWETVAREIRGSRFIASSSLHGLIAADSYGIPSIWVRISNEIAGGEFKFHDYLQSVSRHDLRGYSINGEIDLREIVQKAERTIVEPIKQRILDVLFNKSWENRVDL